MSASVTFATPYFSTGFEVPDGVRPGFELKGWDTGSAGYVSAWHPVQPDDSTSGTKSYPDVALVWFPLAMADCESDATADNTYYTIYYDADVARVCIVSDQPFKIQFLSTGTTAGTLTTDGETRTARSMGFNTDVEYAATLQGGVYKLTARYGSPLFWSPRRGMTTYNVREPVRQHVQVVSAANRATTERVGVDLPTASLSFDHLPIGRVMQYHESETGAAGDRVRGESWAEFVASCAGGHIVTFYDHRRPVSTAQTLLATSDDNETKIADTVVAADTIRNYDMHVVSGKGLGQRRTIATQTTSGSTHTLAPDELNGSASWASAVTSVGGVPVEGSTIAIVRRMLIGTFDADTLDGGGVRRMGSNAEFFSVAATMNVYNW